MASPSSSTGTAVLRNVVRAGELLDLLSVLGGCTAGIAAVLHGAGVGGGRAAPSNWGALHALLSDSDAVRYFLLLTAVPLLTAALYELWMLTTAMRDFDAAIDVAVGNAERWYQLLAALPSGRWHVRLAAAACIYASMAASLAVSPGVVVYYNVAYVPLRVAALMLAHEITLYHVRHTKID